MHRKLQTCGSGEGGSVLTGLLRRGVEMGMRGLGHKLLKHLLLWLRARMLLYSTPWRMSKRTSVRSASRIFQWVVGMGLGLRGNAGRGIDCGSAVGVGFRVNGVRGLKCWMQDMAAPMAPLGNIERVWSMEDKMRIAGPSLKSIAVIKCQMCSSCSVRFGCAEKRRCKIRSVNILYEKCPLLGCNRIVVKCWLRVYPQILSDQRNTLE